MVSQDSKPAHSPATAEPKSPATAAAGEAPANPTKAQNPSAAATAAAGAAATDLEKKMRGAERFGTQVVMSEDEKRSSRAERPMVREAAMEEYGGGGDLLSEAMCSGTRVVVVEDCVEAPGAFVLHLLLKRALAGGGGAAILALAQPFSHYDRVLRKMGCNLSVHRKSERLHFLDLQAFPGGTLGSGIADSLAQLYNGVRRVVEASMTKESTGGQFTVMIDDVSLLEVAANGSADDVLDFLHYCVALTSEMNCSLVVLIHEDIYSSQDGVGLLLHLCYIADLVIRAAPLSTGLAADVHGQLSVVNKGMMLSEQRLVKGQKVWNFHFKVKENGAEFFYPGSVH